ncbi:MAG: peroxiredoxin [Mycoplasmataceae bacterium]|nr:peroxiredoxin [Mycoplasmataceae bacterium]
MKTIFKNKERNLLGNQISIGSELKFKAIDFDFGEYSFDNLDKITIFSIFPSISTRVCDLQTLGISKLAKQFDNFNFVAISLDLPTTLKEWCGAHNIENIMAVSDYKEREFGLKTGFLMDEIFLLNRGVIILDKDSKVIFLSRNTDVHKQINFEELENYLKTL